MPSIFARGQALLNRVSDADAAETVRVIRGASVLCDEWSATPGRTQLETIEEGQQTVIGDRRDWLGDPSEWRLEGVPTDPLRGDLIEWVKEQTVYVFEVMPADGHDCWAPSGTFENRIRVHTKLVDTRANP